MKDQVHAAHGLQDTVVVAYVAEIELDGAVLQPPPHVVLLLLIAAEDADLPEAGMARHLNHRVAEGAGAARDKQAFTSKSA